MRPEAGRVSPALGYTRAYIPTDTRYSTVPVRARFVCVLSCAGLHVACLHADCVQRSCIGAAKGEAKKNRSARGGRRAAHDSAMRIFEIRNSRNSCRACQMQEVKRPCHDCSTICILAFPMRHVLRAVATERDIDIRERCRRRDWIRPSSRRGARSRLFLRSRPPHFDAFQAPSLALLGPDW